MAKAARTTAVLVHVLIAACGGAACGGARSSRSLPPGWQPPEPPAPANSAAAASSSSSAPPPPTPPLKIVKYESTFDSKHHVCSIKEIAAYCQGRPCPSFDDEWDVKERSFRNTCKKDEQPFNEMGGCGNGHYVKSNGGFSGWTRWFDAKGKLIAADEWADYGAYCDHQAFIMMYGTPPKCTEQPIQKLCERPSL
jgi:hypothetical protein